MVEIDELLYFMIPNKKRVKGVQKGVFLDLEQKVRKFSKMKKKFGIHIYCTPFTLFDKNLRKEVIYYSHPIF